MKKILLFLLMLTVLVAGCKNDEGGISITKSSTEILYPVVNQSTTVSFTTSDDWTVSTTANWLTITPMKGNAGNNTITITTASTNRTKYLRSAEVMIKSGSSQQTVTVRQSGDYAVFDQEEYHIDAEGGTVQLTFTTNIESSDKLTVAYNATSWIGWPNAESRMTRAEYKGSLYPLTVQPNTDRDSRTAIYVLAMLIGDREWIGLDTVYVTQSGVNSGYESTDYSADGTVRVVQKASVGKGIPVVLMGDGFADKDIADGTYDQVMDKAIENLFSEEPVKSLRDYFNIYTVTAVSKNDAVGEEYTTAFSCVPDNQSTNVYADEEMVYKYMRKTGDADSLNALSVVILNTNLHKGVTYLYSSKDGLKQYAACFCPVIQNLESEQFRLVLVHEAIGHGLAKLADEYGYEKNGAATQEAIKQVEAYHKYNWMKNIDTTDDVTKVDWARFIGDSCFASENIGVYNGAYTFATGLYRPTEQSLMNSNASPFNAPSRKIIYDRVMLLGKGKASSSFEEFVQFDEQHKPTVWEYALSRGMMAKEPLRFAPPRLIQRKW